jgi:hypothetical protein
MAQIEVKLLSFECFQARLMVRGKASGMEGFQTTFDLVGWLKQKRR